MWGSVRRKYMAWMRPYTEYRCFRCDKVYESYSKRCGCNIWLYKVEVRVLPKNGLYVEQM